MRTIFLCLDTVRRDALRAYNDQPWVQTPNLDRLAGQSVVFRNHFVGSLPCMPARREFMTGRHEFLHRGWGALEPYDRTWPELIRNQVGGFSHLCTDHYHYFEPAAPNYYCVFDTWEFERGQENDVWVSRVDLPSLPDHHPRTKLKPQSYANRLRQQNEEDFSGPRTIAAGMRWLEENKDSDNWCLQLELFDPHEPFDIPEQYKEMYPDSYDGPLFDWPPYAQVEETDEQVQHIRNRYAALLTMTDVWVGKLLDKLEALGIDDEVAIVFTTDHGTFLGERGYWMKNYMPVTNELAQIPLFLRLPGKERAGQQVDQLTSSVDLMPTFLELFGAEAPDNLHGRSILPTLEGQAIRETALYGYFASSINITDGQETYFRNPSEEVKTCTAYSATLGNLTGRADWSDIGTTRDLSFTRGLPVYEVPVKAGCPRDVNRKLLWGEHRLFDLRTDPGQIDPVTDPTRLAAWEDRLRTAMATAEAPEAQYTRMGLG